MMNETEKAREFSRRRNLPGVTVRYMPSKRSMDVILSLMGREIGSSSTTITRGKPGATLYILPEMA